MTTMTNSQPVKKAIFDGGAEYRGADLRACRYALGLRLEVVAELLGIRQDKYLEREQSRVWRSVGLWLVDELQAMEEFVEGLAAQAISAVVADDAPDPATSETVALEVLASQEQFTSAFPDASTLRDGTPYPVDLQYVAIGRAAAELSRRGYTVEVYRGDRRVDLMVRRLAVGLGTNEAARLFGSTLNKYVTRESGKSAPPAGMLAELKAIESFIAQTAENLPVEHFDSYDTVPLFDDQALFRRVFPQARTIRDGWWYPASVAGVAAIRRARAIAAAGREVRIISATPA